MERKILEAGADLPDNELPPYAAMLHAYHVSRATELRALVARLPIAPGDRVLDLACGDACFSRWLAERGAVVVGVDRSPAYLDLARRSVAETPVAERIGFQQADVRALPFPDGSFDLVWCAQSLFSLPDPLEVLREMARVARPGGAVAVLENDNLHHMIIPWPAELELAVRQAQFRALEQRSDGPLHKYYIGRDLCGLFTQVGIDQCEVQTVAVERHAPLAEAEEQFLRDHFAQLRRLIAKELDRATLQAFDLLFDPASDADLLRRPDFHLTHLEMLAVGRKPA
ncbi:MAG TPA: methyltransferase domain-containing protein [Roseiflexaceae bacterium]|nr:methyltransferase domain-containing protein [Roseiflexaceae bacterium]